MGLLLIEIAPALAAFVFGLLLLVNVLLWPSRDSTFVTAQRLSEVVLGLAASVLGLAILFSLLVLVTLSGFSIGLLFLPSLYLALIACSLSLMPRPANAAAR